MGLYLLQRLPLLLPLPFPTPTLLHYVPFLDPPLYQLSASWEYPLTKWLFYISIYIYMCIYTIISSSSIYMTIHRLTLCEWYMFMFSSHYLISEFFQNSCYMTFCRGVCFSPYIYMHYLLPIKSLTHPSSHSPVCSSTFDIIYVYVWHYWFILYRCSLSLLLCSITVRKW